jgi:hypothetical protein
MVEPLGHRQTKGAATDMPGLLPPRHIPTLPPCDSPLTSAEWPKPTLIGPSRFACPARSATIPYAYAADTSARRGRNFDRAVSPLQSGTGIRRGIHRRVSQRPHADASNYAGRPASSRRDRGTSDRNGPVTVTGDVAELNQLFVEPTRLRSGGGRALFGWAEDTPRQAGATTRVIDSDPDASGFYRRIRDR